MPGLDFDNSVMVFAHPDDEVLWASSLLNKVKKIIICFGEANRSQKLKNERANALYNYPLKNVYYLNLTESETYDSVKSWTNPTEQEWGIECLINNKAYIRTGGKLYELLANLLKGEATVITHNPWGEYGHEDHVQLFNVVNALRKFQRFDMYVTSYVSNRSLNYAFEKFYLLSHDTNSFETDLDLTKKIKDIYIKFNCWTWDKNYCWPKRETFYKINKLDCDNIEQNIIKYRTTPLLNFIVIENETTFNSILRKVKIYIRKFWFVLFRNKRSNEN